MVYCIGRGRIETFDSRTALTYSDESLLIRDMRPVLVAEADATNLFSRVNDERDSTRLYLGVARRTQCAM
jgi:hypothetical protein